jgi:hypothetical protein
VPAGWQSKLQFLRKYKLLFMPQDWIPACAGMTVIIIQGR